MPLECGTGQRLILTNVTYEQQGQYICLASNKINGNVREVKSDPVSLQVVGAPRVRQRLASRRGAAERWKSFAANQNYRGGPTLTDSVSGGPVAKKYRFITLRDPRDHWISFARAATEYPREYFARSPSFSFDCPEYRWKKKDEWNVVCNEEETLLPCINLVLLYYFIEKRDILRAGWDCVCANVNSR